VATWEVSEDGLTYTFNIMEGISWVKYNPDSGEVEQVTDENGNVRMLTAHDFVYAVQRTLAPETAGDYAYVLAPWIVGGNEYNSGEGSVDDVAIQALDDYTLQITAPEKAAFVPNIYGMWMATAEPSWVIDEFAESWTEPENIQSYGPFALKEWNHEENISMIKNPFTCTDNIPQPTLDEVNFVMLDESAQLANYEAGLMHVADPPLADLDRIKADPVLSQELSIAPAPAPTTTASTWRKIPSPTPRPPQPSRWRLTDRR
jgi:oligopeptide transport system substrate-binding protein